MSKSVMILAIVLTPAVIQIATVFQRNTAKNTTQGNQGVSITTHTYQDIEHIPKGIAIATSQEISSTHKIKAAIIPHHSLVSEEIAKFWKRLSIQKPSIIILFGPNHDEIGNTKIITSSTTWQTAFGQVNADRQAFSQLLGKNTHILSEDTKIVATDHTIGTHLPFIAAFLPNTQVVPFLLSSRLNRDELATFATELREQWPDTPQIASIDFSHYLPVQQANNNDVQTIDFIKSKNISKILQLNSDYLDSPASLATILLNNSLQNFQIHYHGNSSTLSQNTQWNTTSYMIIEWY